MSYLKVADFENMLTNFAYLMNMLCRKNLTFVNLLKILNYLKSEPNLLSNLVLLFLYP